ncbi:MAG: 2-oxoglutarate ferredoxin oxidoreductase subunit gamma [Anaerolineaceae bacterium]|nr:MAG: 2-oxoglutarate ferredoxin oxidoreductase subunit gamma [Anaerolineaceae bacterium]
MTTPRAGTGTTTKMADRTEVRLAGEGGQGMILAGIILAEAAIHDGRNAVQTQSYGPEARGGASKAEVVISSGEIDHPEVLEADVVITLSQAAFQKFSGSFGPDGRLIAADKEESEKASGSIKPGGWLIVDEEKVDSSAAPKNVRLIRLPITKMAVETTGKGITANTVALGVLVGLTDVVSREAIEKAVTARAPKGTEDMNRKALQAGFDAAERVKAKK